MKNILTLALVFVSFMAFGQITTPSASPACMVKQTVGLTDISVEYARPSVKGRTIFAADGLVPHGNVWRTGANAATKVTFSDDVTVNGNALSAGSYAILTKPMADKWDVHFYNYEGRSWSSYVEKEPALITSSNTVELPIKVESFMIMFDNLTAESATLEFVWENTLVALEIGVNVDDKVMADINKVLGGPSPGDYYNAANYYHSMGKDLDQALEWINIATDIPDPKFWQVRRKALILADLGKKDEAISAAKQSLMLAEKAGNADYIALNKKSIAEWTK